VPTPALPAAPAAAPAPRPPRLSRRVVLAAASAATAGAGLAAAAHVVSWWDRPPGAALRCLSSDEAETLDSFAEALFPPGGSPALSGRDAGVSAFLDEVLSRFPDPESALLRVLLHALDDWSRFSHGAAFSALLLPARQDRLRAWLAHRRPEVRSAVSSLVYLATQGYAGHPSVVAECGWLFPCGFER
jgi:hypothetical protein